MSTQPGYSTYSLRLLGVLTRGVQMAPDLVKALEYSKQAVPRDLKELADECKERIKQARPEREYSEYPAYPMNTQCTP